MGPVGQNFNIQKIICPLFIDYLGFKRMPGQQISQFFGHWQFFLEKRLKPIIGYFHNIFTA